MTEQEWLESSEPESMLEFLRGQASERKLRLFACACCRRLWDLVESWYQELGEIIERFADGQATQDDVFSGIEIAHDPDNTAGFAFESAGSFTNLLESAIGSADDAAHAIADSVTGFPINWENDPDWTSAHLAECLIQVSFVVCIFGNPFRPVAFDPAWRTPSVTAIGQAIYTERRFADLPILADALEEAGCTSLDILEHCRSGGEHVRACWVVDLVLDKE